MTEQENLPTQPLVNHMLELRDRLLRTFIAVFVVFVCMFPFSEQLYLFISEPIRSFLPESSTMIATEVASPFLTPLNSL